MNHKKTAGRSNRCRRLVSGALLVVLTATSLLAADQAMARKAKGGLSPGTQSGPAAQAAQAARAAQVAPEVIKPISHPRRHGAKGRPVSR